MQQREETVSTYMGNELAIPHGTNETKHTILDSALSVVRYENPIDWDGNEVLFALGIAGWASVALENSRLYEDARHANRIFQATGVPREGFPAGTPWEQVPDDWACPDCAVRDKVDFEPVG